MIQQNNSRLCINLDCEYYPCHDMPNGAPVNCLFCYCPLYLCDDCGGNPTITNGWKDCSQCVLPHIDYDWVVKRIVELHNSDNKGDRENEMY